MAHSRSFIAVPPGATIREQLEERGLTQKEFAVRMGISEKHISRLIHGDVELSQDMALRLESVLGIPAKFWNNLEAIYREKLTRVKEELEMDEEVEIAKKFPYSKMAARGWVKNTRNAKEKVFALRSFFETARLTFLGKFQIPGIVYRQLGENDRSDYALAAWSQKVRLEARKVEAGEIDIKKLTALLPRIRALSKGFSADSYKKLRDCLAECGVALVYLPHFEGTFLNGASFIDGKKIVVGVTTRGKFADIFWFNLFHELGHVIAGDIFGTHDAAEREGMERAADTFAQDALIPAGGYERFTEAARFDRESVCAFAEKVGIAPGIVVGRLQKEGRLRYDCLGALKAKYEIFCD